MGIDMRIICVALVALMAAAWAFSAWKRRRLLGEFQRLLVAERYDDAERLLASRSAHFAFPEYNRTYLLLNIKVMRGELEAADRIFDGLLSRHLPPRLREDLVMKAFEFYVELKDGKRSRSLLDEIEGWDSLPDARKAAARQMYDVMIAGSSAYIDEMERSLEGATRSERVRLLFLLGTQYENKGDKARATSCFERMASESDGSF